MQPSPALNTRSRITTHAASSSSSTAKKKNMHKHHTPPTSRENVKQKLRKIDESVNELDVTTSTLQADDKSAFETNQQGNGGDRKVDSNHDNSSLDDAYSKESVSLSDNPVQPRTITTSKWDLDTFDPFMSVSDMSDDNYNDFLTCLHKYA